MTELAVRDAVLMIRGRLVDGPDGYLGGYKVAVPAGQETPPWQR